MREFIQRGVLLCGVLLLPALALAADDQPGHGDGPLLLDEQIQTLKSDIQALNRELAILEEELLFPETGQVSVYVSLEADDAFRLDAVQLKIDNKVVTNHLYSNDELVALRRGGVQRLYLGNLKSGEHTVEASFTTSAAGGIGQAQSFSFTKDKGARYLQLKVRAAGKQQQADISLREWE